MDPIKEWQRQIRALLEKIEGATNTAKEESRDFTTEEDQQVNEWLDEVEVLKRKIDTERRRLAAVEDAPEDETRIEVTQDQADKPFEGFGEFLQCVARASLPGGSRLNGKPTGVVDKRLFSRMEDRASGMSESIPSDGGFLVGKDYAQELIKKAHETGMLAKKCRKVPIGANSNGLRVPTIDETSRATGSRLGGIRVYRKQEAEAPTASQMKFGKLSIDLEDMIGLCYVTNDLLQDSASLESIVNQGFADEFSFKLDDEVVNGNGAGQCLGILESDALVSVSKESGQGAETINAKNVIKMYARAWSRSRNNMVWLANQDIIPQLYTLVLPAGTGGIPMFQPAGGLSGKPFDTLFGKEILFVEQASTLGTVGDIVLADLSQYLIIDKGGLQNASSIHVKFTTNEMAFRFVYRVNGQPIWDAPLTPYKGTGNTVSPFVALATRS